MFLGAMDQLDISDHCPIAEHYENRLKLLELYMLGFYGFHTTEHHCTALSGGACCASSPTGGSSNGVKKASIPRR